MKNLVTITSAFLAIGASASAQVAFEGMEISVNVLAPTTGTLGDFISYGVDGNATYSIGSFGVQADFGVKGFGGSAFIANLGEYNAGLHLFGAIGENVKLGAFYSYDFLSDSSFVFDFPTFGAEVMLSFGKLDAEFSVGGIGGDLVSDLVIITADGYYHLNQSWEVSAGYWTLISTSGGGDFGIARIGANYQFANIPVSVGASYSFGVTGGGSSGGAVEATVSYSFGPETGKRSFSNRSFSYLDLILIASS